MPIDRSKQIDAFLETLPEVKPHNLIKPIGLDEKIFLIILEINEFFEKNNREPENSASASYDEKSLAIKLARLRQDFKNKSSIAELDIHKLISEKSSEDTTNQSNLEETIDQENEVLIPDMDDIEDAPTNIDAFLDKIDLEQDDIFQLKNVRPSSEKIIQADYVSQRVHCPNFHEYEPLFEEVKKQLDQGIRETLPFKKEYEIKQGQFFILNGLMVYISKMEEEFEKNGKLNARMKVIFSNGTEGNNLKRSIASELYKDKAGRRISDPRVKGLFSNQKTDEDIGTGTVYVLKSKSDHPRILPVKPHLHKIGVTKSTVKQRISNAKNDPTYLLSDVEVVAEFSIYNIKASKIENLLQKYFDCARADITIEDRFGRPVKSTEWFFVLPQTVKKAVDLLVAGKLQDTFYDAKEFKIKEK